MDQIKIGKFISELRKEKGMTQEQLAVKLGVTKKCFSLGNRKKHARLVAFTIIVSRTRHICFRTS